MTVKEILDMIVHDRGPIIATIIILMSLIQIAPIKLDPWTAIISWLGSHLNKDVIDKMDSLEKRVKDVDDRLSDHINKSELEKLEKRRATILEFGSSVMRGINYHQEEFNFMIKECDFYEEYCNKNGVANGVAKASISEIRRIYQEKLRSDDFLKEGVSDNMPINIDC